MRFEEQNCEKIGKWKKLLYLNSFDSHRRFISFANTSVSLRHKILNK